MFFFQPKLAYLKRDILRNDPHGDKSKGIAEVWLILSLKSMFQKFFAVGNNLMVASSGDCAFVWPLNKKHFGWGSQDSSLSPLVVQWLQASVNNAAVLVITMMLPRFLNISAVFFFGATWGHIRNNAPSLVPRSIFILILIRERSFLCFQSCLPWNKEVYFGPWVHQLRLAFVKGPTTILEHCMRHR